MTKKSIKKSSTFESKEEPDRTKGMGIFPDDISLSQNIGCVRSKSKTDKIIRPEK